MTIHLFNDLEPIRYVGSKTMHNLKQLEKTKKFEVQTGDFLFVPALHAKFLTREGQPFEKSSISEIKDTLNEEAISRINSQKLTILELENELETQQPQEEVSEEQPQEEVSEGQPQEEVSEEQPKKRTPRKTNKKESTT